MTCGRWPHRGTEAAHSTSFTSYCRRSPQRRTGSAGRKPAPVRGHGLLQLGEHPAPDWSTDRHAALDP